MKRLRRDEQAHADRAEVLAMIAAWRVSVVAEEEVEAADAQVLAGEAAADAQADEADAGGHYGDA